MRTFFLGAKRVALFVLKNGDAFLAIIVAACVIAAEVLGKPSTEIVDSAILALLGALAIAILRDREKNAGLEDLRQLAEDAVSELPYVVVWQNNHWDLVDRENARVTCLEELRFTRQEVSENSLWSNGPGVLERVTARWRRSSNDAWVSGKKLGQIPARGGIKEVFSFNDEHGTGDVLEWCVERDIRGQFPEENEGVAVEARTKSDHPRTLRITWPQDARPSRVEIREGSRPPRTIRPRTKDNRPYVKETVSGLRICEVVKIDWSW